eukprot:51493-Pelagomonas_calceolata.AAC.2
MAYTPPEHAPPEYAPNAKMYYRALPPDLQRPPASPVWPAGFYPLVWLPDPSGEGASALFNTVSKPSFCRRRPHTMTCSSQAGVVDASMLCVIKAICSPKSTTASVAPSPSFGPCVHVISKGILQTTLSKYYKCSPAVPPDGE